jgi:hypothetical protein
MRRLPLALLLPLPLLLAVNEWPSHRWPSTGGRGEIGRWPDAPHAGSSDSSMFALAFMGDSRGTRGADLTRLLDFLIAQQGVPHRNVRGFFHSGEFSPASATSDPGRIAQLDAIKGIGNVLAWGLVPSHGAGGQLACRGPSPAVCNSDGLFTDLGGSGLGFQWGSRHFYWNPRGYEEESGNSISDRDIWWVIHAFPYLRAGVLRIHRPACSIRTRPTTGSTISTTS